ncbi:MAG: S9 family peptidase [Armatimonadota bacterium]|nr:S9 family peptidase [Armatimonadota bacterium]MDR7534123.1 S9 family peptidase [Armatimonadota bacterium]MDR7535843.1 S9 family peptidase [Armatimonadota bacterium]
MMNGRPMTPEDLLSLRWVTDVALAPDGRTVAYALERVGSFPGASGARRFDYRSHLWVVDAGGGEPRQFTTGEQRDRHPVWSPDGRAVLFLSDRRAAPAATGKPPAHLWVIPAAGGEARQLTQAEHGPVEPAWSPDGTQIAFSGKPPVTEPPACDVKIITRLRHKADGEGLWDGRYRHIFVVPAAGGPAWQLTAGPFDHREPAWSPDGRRLAFVANRSEDADATNVADLWVVDATGGAPRRLTRSVGPVASPAWSPDGAQIAYLGHENACMGASNVMLWVVSADGSGEPRCLTRHYDRSLAHHLLSDMRAHPRGSGPVWSPDGRFLFVLVADGGSTQLAAVEVSTGLVHLVTTGRHDIYAASFDARCARVAMAISTPAEPGDVWIADVEGPADGRPAVAGARRLTAVNQELLAGVALSTPQRFAYRGADDWTIEGWVMAPVGAAPDARAPTILCIHGGPHAAYGETFFHEFQVLAGAGYALVFTNPRGSQGYGQAFTAATHHDWGGKDCEDILAGLDAALARFPFLDPQRLGVQGGSYGGFMTNWIIGHTPRFQAAVTMRSIVNCLSQWGTSDLAYFKGYWEFPGDPWENPTFYWERSPLAHVHRITTPLLILHSEQDLRCPIGEAEQLFTALKKLGREVVFVRFPDEGHDLSRSGQPGHRVERLRLIRDWFDRHLAAVPVQAAPEPASAPAAAEQGTTGVPAHGGRAP